MRRLRWTIGGLALASCGPAHEAYSVVELAAEEGEATYIDGNGRVYGHVGEAFMV